MPTKYVGSAKAKGGKGFSSSSSAKKDERSSRSQITPPTLICSSSSKEPSKGAATSSGDVPGVPVPILPNTAAGTPTAAAAAAPPPIPPNKGTGLFFGGLKLSNVVKVVQSSARLVCCADHGWSLKRPSFRSIVSSYSRDSTHEYFYRDICDFLCSCVLLIDLLLYFSE